MKAHMDYNSQSCRALTPGDDGQTTREENVTPKTQDISKRITSYPSALRLLFVTVVSIFVAETIVMFLLSHYAPDISF